MPKRIGLPLPQWPLEDRQAWARSCAPADYFDEVNTAARWRPKTREGVQASYGRWLAFLQRQFPTALAEPPAVRVSKRHVQPHLQTLLARISATSVASELQHLIMAFRAIAPGPDLSWLHRLQYRVQSTAVPRDKRSRMVHPARLLDLAFDLMENAGSHRNPLEQARAFRDGLMVGLLIARPVRRMTLATIQIGRELQRSEAGYVLVFGDDTMKTGKAVEFDVPEYLTSYLDMYLQQYRKIFPRADSFSGLWASSFGCSLTYAGVYDTICRRTKVQFGFSINPHLFRDMAATAISRELPESFALAKDLLSHANLSMTMSHYVRASTLQASRRHADTIALLRGTV